MSYEVWWGNPPTGEQIIITEDPMVARKAASEYIADHPLHRFGTRIIVYQGKNKGNRGQMDLLGRITWNK